MRKTEIYLIVRVDVILSEEKKTAPEPSAYKDLRKDETHLSLYNAIDQWVHVSGIKGMFQCWHFIHTATQGPNIRLEKEIKCNL